MLDNNLVTLAVTDEHHRLMGNAERDRVDTRMFEGAGHGFSGHETELAAALADWAETLS